MMMSTFFSEFVRNPLVPLFLSPSFSFFFSRDVKVLRFFNLPFSLTIPLFWPIRRGNMRSDIESNDSQMRKIHCQSRI